MENIRDKVSIITVCYNCSAALESTVQSVLSQSYSNKEYIVIDGNSTDNTPEVLQRYSHAIDVCVRESDDGVYDAMNKGLRLASGEWVIFMNAGDTFASDDVLSSIFSKPIPSDKSFLYSDFWLLNADGYRTLRHTDRHIGEVHHQNAIYRRSLHERYGYYIVTHPYIVSDLLFFMAVPEHQYLKVDSPIAIVLAGGLSDSLWCSEQAWAVKVIYGIETIPQIFFRDIRMRFGIWRKKIKKRLYGK